MSRFPRAVQAYIAAVIASGAVALLVTVPQRFDAPDLVLFATLAVAGVLAGTHPLPLAHRHGMISLTGGVLLMSVFLTSLPVACLLAAVVAILTGLIRRRRPWNTLFMSGVNVLSVGLAAALYRGVAHSALLPMDDWANVLGLYLAASSYWLSISAMVTVLVAARNSEPFLRTLANNWREVYLQCILLTLLAVLGAAAWRQGAVYASLLLVPAVALYQLLSMNRLKQEQVIHAIETIAEVLDRRNPFTFQHSSRVAEHAVRMARQLGLSELDLETLRRAALIHDMGKLGVDDPQYELPPTRAELTDYQFYSLKQHAQLGAMIAREIPAFEDAEEPIRYHHDWYDGSHVSRAHSGSEIPLGARIIAVADSYDQLCMANGEASLAFDPIAAEQLRGMRGRQLDPELVTRFVAIVEAEQAAGSRPALLTSDLAGEARPS